MSWKLGNIQGSEHASNRVFEPGDVSPHRFLGSIRVAVADRFEQFAMLLHGIVETRHAVEREEPDAKRENVVLVQRLFSSPAGRTGTVSTGATWPASATNVS